MSKAPSKAAAFPEIMQKSTGEPGQGPTAAVAVAPAPPRRLNRGRCVRWQRSGLKHFGGYLEDDTLEKIALLRVRLKKDNSDLIKLAIDELHAKHKARRALRNT